MNCYFDPLAGRIRWLVLVAGFQIRLLVLAGRTAEEQATQLKKSTDFAETQNAIISAQTDIQRKQHEIGRLQYVASHRPRLRFRYAILTSANAEQQCCVTVYFANVGTTPAFPKQVGCDVFIKVPDKTVKFDARPTPWTYDKEIHAGNEVKIEVFSKQLLTISDISGGARWC